MKFFRAMPLLLVLAAMSTFSLACGGGHDHTRVVEREKVIVEPHHH